MLGEKELKTTVDSRDSVIREWNRAEGQTWGKKHIYTKVVMEFYG